MITEQELKDFAVTVPYSFEYIRLFVINLKEEQRNLEFVTKIFNLALGANLSPYDFLPILK